MPRTWTELLGDAEGPYETETARQGFVGRLRDSLSRSRRALTEQIVALLGADQAASWKEMTGEPFKGPPPQPPFMHGHGKKGPPNK